MKHLIHAIALLSFAAGAHAASFDCTKASTVVEKTICSDSKLSELDDSLTLAYKNAVASNPAPSILKSEQRAWLAGVRNKCTDASCLNRAYTDRIKVLTESAIPTPTSAITSQSNSPTGTYKTQGGELKVQKISDSQIQFEIFATFRMNTGEASGVAVLKGDNAIYENREDDCRLSFRFASRKAVVTQDGGCAMGLNVSASGTYNMASNNVPKFETTDAAPQTAPVKTVQPAPAAKNGGNPSIASVVAKNSAKVSSLGFPNKLLKATIYLQTDMVNAPRGVMTFESFIALLFENPRISKITSIKSGKSEGVLLKVQGVQSSGFLFNYDDGDMFPSHVVKGDEASPIETTEEMYAVSLAIMQIAAAGIQSTK